MELAYKGLTASEIQDRLEQAIKNAESQHLDLLVNIVVNEASVEFCRQASKTKEAADYSKIADRLRARAEALQRGIAVLYEKFAEQLSARESDTTLDAPVTIR